MSIAVRLILLLICTSLLAGCNIQATPVPASEVAPTSTEEAIEEATQGGLFLMPMPPAPEGPLESALVSVPEAIIVSGRQSLDDLATYYKTTPEQLRWTNPDLTDPVEPGTLVIIPAVYRTAEGETLSTVSEATGIPEQLLSAANPSITTEETLAADIVLVVPTLYIVEDEVSVNGAAEQL
jgi:LysM repeat protein